MKHLLSAAMAALLVSSASAVYYLESPTVLDYTHTTGGSATCTVGGLQNPDGSYYPAVVGRVGAGTSASRINNVTQQTASASANFGFKVVWQADEELGETTPPTTSVAIRVKRFHAYSHHLLIGGATPPASGFFARSRVTLSGKNLSYDDTYTFGYQATADRALTRLTAHEENGNTVDIVLHDSEIVIVNLIQVSPTRWEAQRTESGGIVTALSQARWNTVNPAPSSAMSRGTIEIQVSFA